MDKVCNILSVISKNKKLCYVTGDYNLDLLCCNDHTSTQEFVKNLFSYIFIPLINKPTQITAHSATLIDIIFTNNLSDKVLSSILINDISDHLPILSYLFDDSVVLKNQLYKPTRNYNEANINSFRTCLSEVNGQKFEVIKIPMMRIINSILNTLYFMKYAFLGEKRAIDIKRLTFSMDY
jgi:hypothetical protein